jgi:glycosyltransferase involved in cell wall biosynthesis
MPDIKKPKFSVLIPVYNGENFLRQALESVHKQTFADFECIVIDDGSSDNQYIQLALTELNDSRFRALSKKNGGVASALNLGIRECKGDYIAWLSHDDLWESQKLEIQQKFLDDKAVLCSNYRVVNSENSIVAETHFQTEYNTNSGVDLIARGLIHGCTVIVPKLVIEEVGFFDERLLYTQDYDYWIRVAKSGFNFVFLDEITVTARVHDEQTGRKSDTRVENNFLWRRIVDLWNESNVSEQKEDLGSKLDRIYEFKVWAMRNGLIHTAEYLEKIELDSISEVRVTVIIPFRDLFSKIIEATNSVLAQTHENIELIIVDDGHEEYDAEQLLRSKLSISQFSKVHIFKNGGFGVSSARNLGLEMSTGDFIAFLDADDVFLPNKIHVQLTHMLRKRVSFSHTNYFDFNNFLSKNYVNDTSINSGEGIIASIVKNSLIATPTVMIQKNLHTKNLFDENRFIGEDSDAWLSFLLKSGTSNVHISECLTVVRTGEVSAKFNLLEVKIAKKRNTQKYLDTLNRKQKFGFRIRTFLCGFFRLTWALAGRNQNFKNSVLIKRMAKSIRGY